MSAYGSRGGGTEKAADKIERAGDAVSSEFEKVTRALAEFGKAVLSGARAAKDGGGRSGLEAAGGLVHDATIGFARNYAVSEARSFARGTAGGVASGIAAGTLDLSGAGLASVAQENAAFGIGSQTADPIRAAAARVGGITTAIARAGGQVTPELREALQGRFVEQERRADAEARAIQRMASKAVGEALGPTETIAAGSTFVGGVAISAILGRLGITGR